MTGAVPLELYLGREAHGRSQLKGSWSPSASFHRGCPASTSPSVTNISTSGPPDAKADMWCLLAETLSLPSSLPSARATQELEVSRPGRIPGRPLPTQAPPLPLAPEASWKQNRMHSG